MNSYGQIALPLGRHGQIIRNFLLDAEVEQVQRLLEARGGGEFIGQTVPNMPGIDGWLDGVPTSLKRLNSTNPLRLFDFARKAWRKLAETEYRGARVHIDARMLTVQQVINFVTGEKASPTWGRILSSQTVTHLSVLTSDGLVNFY